MSQKKINGKTSNDKKLVKDLTKKQKHQKDERSRILNPKDEKYQKMLDNRSRQLNPKDPKFAKKEETPSK